MLRIKELSETVTMKVVKMARDGQSDDLAFFYNWFLDLSRDTGATFALVRDRVTFVFGDGEVAHLHNGDEQDRLDDSTVRLFLRNSGEPGDISRVVYDLFDDLWRSLNGQEIENPPKLRRAL